MPNGFLGRRIKMKISVQGKQEYIPDKTRDLFLKEFRANKNHLNLVKEELNVALFYYHCGYCVGFHKGYESQKSTKPSKAKGA